MATRATISVHDDSNTFHITKHWDGDPKNVADLLSEACKYAWPLPRFEADEFTAAIIRAAKTGPGDVRLATCAEGSPQYHYRVYCKNGTDELMPQIIVIVTDEDEFVGSFTISKLGTSLFSPNLAWFVN